MRISRIYSNNDDHFDDNSPREVNMSFWEDELDLNEVQKSQNSGTSFFIENKTMDTSLADYVMKTTIHEHKPNRPREKLQKSFDSMVYPSNLTVEVFERNRVLRPFSRVNKRETLSRSLPRSATYNDVLDSHRTRRILGPGSYELPDLWHSSRSGKPFATYLSKTNREQSSMKNNSMFLRPQSQQDIPLHSHSHLKSPTKYQSTSISELPYQPLQTTCLDSTHTFSRLDATQSVQLLGNSSILEQNHNNSVDDRRKHQYEKISLYDGSSVLLPKHSLPKSLLHASFAASNSECTANIGIRGRSCSPTNHDSATNCGKLSTDSTDHEPIPNAKLFITNTLNRRDDLNLVENQKRAYLPSARSNRFIKPDNWIGPVFKSTLKQKHRQVISHSNLNLDESLYSSVNEDFPVNLGQYQFKNNQVGNLACKNSRQITSVKIADILPVSTYEDVRYSSQNHSFTKTHDNLGIRKNKLIDQSKVEQMSESTKSILQPSLKSNDHTDTNSESMSSRNELTTIGDLTVEQNTDC